MMSLLKSKDVLKSSFGIDVKVHICHPKKFCKDMFIQFRFILSQNLYVTVMVLESSSLGHSRHQFLENFENLQNLNFLKTLLIRELSQITFAFFSIF